MISVEEATRDILARITSPRTETLALEDAHGRILREDLVADRDFPPFDRVTMDGIAILFSSWQSGSRTFSIQETAAAGAPQAVLIDPKGCIEVMTGAMLPTGCDTIIRYEDLEIRDGQAFVTADAVAPGQNVHARGSDRRTGDIIVPGNRALGFPEIGIASTIGKSRLQVASKLRIAIISTGDELVGIDDTPAPHQIRQSNVWQIRAILEAHGAIGDVFHLSDNQVETIREVGQLLNQYDALILSGGVSAGKFDYVPDALHANGVRTVFHKVAQRPGKPFWFGVSDLRKVVFAVPGNPVSSFMCTIRYVLPWLHASYGQVSPPHYAILAHDVRFRPLLTYFLQVKLQYNADGSCHAIPAEGHGSGDLANLVDVDAFLELEAGRDVYHAGETYRAWSFR